LTVPWITHDGAARRRKLAGIYPTPGDPLTAARRFWCGRNPVRAEYEREGCASSLDGPSLPGGGLRLERTLSSDIARVSVGGKAELAAAEGV
jgi:hypothetical protein